MTVSNQSSPSNPWSYPEVAKVAKTGDLIFANGTAPGSKIIERVSGGEWSHLGMIIHKADLQFAGFTPPADLPDLLIWESTDLDNLPDIVTGQRVNVMLVSLQDRLYTDAQGNDPFDADIFGYRPFISYGTPASATSALTAEQLARLNHFLTFIHGTPHASHTRMMGEYGAGLLGMYVSTATTFCSKLIAQAYVAMRLLPAHTVPNGLSPNDFAQSTTPPNPDDYKSDKGKMVLESHAKLGQLQYVASPLTPATPSTT